MTGLEVGGWFASAFINELVDRACSYLEDRLEDTGSIQHKFKILDDGLRKIQAVLHEADQRNIENTTLKEWLLDLKDAAYDAENVLDIFEYKILEEKVEGKWQASSSMSRRFFKRARTSVESILFPNDDVDELCKVADRFRNIAKGMEPLIQLIRSEPTVRMKVDEIMQTRETSSMPIEPQLFGRDNERTHLMQLLLQTGGNGGASSSKHVHVIPILGIGGVGKTTLAQEVYNDQAIENHFDLRAWVCVSDNFKVKRLVKEIIESASILRPSDFCNLQNLDRVTVILKRGLAGKRFLIVLDDVWNNVAEHWEFLLSILNSGKEGSSVVITTRIQKVADMMKTKQPITLGGLPDKDYWKFFLHCAFGDGNPENHPNLEFFGKQIAKKLAGNPLAAKTVGAVLKYNMTEEHWSDILERKLWQVDQPEDGIMPVLRLSYDYLPARLKQCFVFCSLFPKHYKFSKKKLVQLWMAQGFVQPDEADTMEKIGKTYFNELISRSFFQKTRWREYGIHDLLHDLAQYLSDGESFRAEDNMSEIKPVEIPNKVRHAYISSKTPSLTCNEYVMKHLRSLVVIGSSGISLDILKDLKGLRVLILEHLNHQLPPESFHSMRHLRYLEVTGNGNQNNKLPESLCKLYHLQVLSPDKYFVLPKGINRLINLRHLDAYEGKTAGIGILASLQQLTFYVNQRERGFEMRQLRDMSQLRRLLIYGLESVESKEQASEAKLCDKRDLKELKLNWSSGRYINPNGVLEGLQPHQNLKTLAIIGYSGNCPSWWNANWVSHLISIELINCSDWEILPPMGQLSFLKVLRLEKMNAVKRIGLEFCGISNKTTSQPFPSLETIFLNEMSELREWCKRPEGLELFPRLSSFEVYECRKLKEPLYLSSPLYSPRVIHLYISESTWDLFSIYEGYLTIRCPNISRLQELLPWQNLALVESVEIMNKEMATFPTELEEWFQHLTSLRSLCFYNCNQLQCLPSMLIESLSTLQELLLQFCSAIQSLPEDGLPGSLRKLVIYDRNTELEERCKKDGLDWHKICHIPTIIINNEDVQILATDAKRFSTDDE